MSASPPAASPLPRLKRRHRPAPPTLSLAAWRQFLSIAKPYWLGDQKKSAWTLIGLLIVLMLCDTQLAVLLIDKSGEMTSALASGERERFWNAAWASLAVLGIAAPVFGFYYFMRDAFSNNWRRWLTHRFLDGYLSGHKYYEIGSNSGIDNPDQRISEDIDTFTGRSINFLLIFIGSLMQLVAFSAVLWSISRTLVAFLVVYALLGTLVTLYVFGAPLIRLNFWQIRREADFRFGLMRLRENAESIAFYRGEPQERAQLDKRFDAVYDNYGRLIRRQCALNIFQRAFGQLTLVVPSIILSGAVLSGELEVGRAVQAAGAFAAVLSAVSLIVDNFNSLSRFVAGIDRLHALSQLVFGQPASQAATVPETAAAADTTPAAAGAPAAAPATPGTPDTPDAPDALDATVAAPAAWDGASPAPQDAAPPSQIRLTTGPQLRLERLTLRTPQFGRLLVADLELALAPGDGLLITGPSGCGKSSLLRAIAGIWHTGSGVVQQLPLDEVFFLPQRPYMQLGTLRSQLIYPSRDTLLDDVRLQEILQEVQLGELAERVGGLNAVHDWEKLLSMGEQQRLAFARVLVREPRLVILDEATSALDSANEAALYTRLRASGTTLVSIAHRPAVLRHHTHVLSLKGGGAWEILPAETFRFEG